MPPTPTPPQQNCKCGRWAWTFFAGYDRENGVIVDLFKCAECGRVIEDRYNPPNEELGDDGDDGGGNDGGRLADDPDDNGDPPSDAFIAFENGY